MSYYSEMRVSYYSSLGTYDTEAVSYFDDVTFTYYSSEKMASYYSNLTVTYFSTYYSSEPLPNLTCLDSDGVGTPVRCHDGEGDPALAPAVSRGVAASILGMASHAPATLAIWTQLKAGELGEVLKSS